MTRRFVIVGVVALALLLLALLGNLTNKVRTERELHEFTKKELVKEKKKIKIRIVRTPFLLPDGQVGIKVEEFTDIETETDKFTDIKDKTDKKVTERPALKKWQAMAAQCIVGCSGQMYGGGYRQSLWIIEPAVWTLWGKDLGLAGLTVAF